MALIQLPQPWTRQPQVPVGINWGNPLTRRLVTATPIVRPIAPATQYDATNLGKPLHWIAGGAASSWVATYESSQYGPMIGGYSTTGWIDTYQFPEVDGLIATSGEVTAMIICQSLGQDGTGNRGPINLTTGAAAQHYPYIDGAIYIGPFSATRWVDGITPTTDVSAPHVAVITARANDKKFYLNGVVNKTSTDAPAPTMLTGGYAYLGERLGAIYALAVWDRYLASDEVVRLSANPWQLYAPIDRNIYFNAAAAGDIFLGQAVL